MFITVLFIWSRIIVVRKYCTYVSHLVTIGTRDHSGEMYGKGKHNYVIILCTMFIYNRNVWAMNQEIQWDNKQYISN